MNATDLRACARFASVVLIAIAAFACIVAGPHPAGHGKRYEAQTGQPRQAGPLQPCLGGAA